MMSTPRDFNDRKVKSLAGHKVGEAPAELTLGTCKG